MALLAAGVIGLGVLAWAARHPAAARAADLDPEVEQSVYEGVARNGRGRVLVELRLPSAPPTPEGRLSGPAAIWGQRLDIASTQSQVISRLQGRLHNVLHQYQTVPYLALEVGPGALAELQAAGVHVRRVMKDTLKAPTLPQSGPLVEADQAWAAGYDGTGVVVAIVDTGVDKTHPFLAGKVIEEACFSSTVSGQSVSVCPNAQSQQIGPGAGVPCGLGGCWHGTHVAGIAAGNGAGAGVSFSGVARGAQIMAVQVFSRFDDAFICGGQTPCVLAWTSDIIAGLEQVYSLSSRHSFSSVNLSLGGGLFSSQCDGEPEKPIIDNLRSVGIATVIAAGNNGSRNALSSPGCISSAVSVGSTTKSDVISSFSNAASFLSLFAPGESILSSYPGGWATATGTSMATPHVTGAFAVLKDAAPNATVGEILTALQQTGLPIVDTRSGGTVTKPRIRIFGALQVLAPGANPVPVLSSLQPSNATAGGPGFTLTVNGSNFLASSVVRWNGASRSTTFVSSGQLTAAIPAGDIAAQGTPQVTVLNPAPGGGTSNSLAFTISPSGVGGSFTDRFNRPDSPTLGNGWTQVAGSLMIQKEQARNSPVKTLHTAVQAGLVGPKQNVAVSFASVDNNGGPRFGVLARYKDSRNYYICYRQTGGSSVLRIAKIVNGVETVLKSAGISNPQKEAFFALRCQADGTTLTLSLDGILKLSVVDAAFSSGSAGMAMGYPSAGGAGSASSHRADDFTASVQ